MPRTSTPAGGAIGGSARRDGQSRRPHDARQPSVLVGDRIEALREHEGERGLQGVGGGVRPGGADDPEAGISRKFRPMLQAAPAMVETG